MANVVWPANSGAATTLPETLALADATTNTAPDAIVEQHTTSGTAAAGFGLTDAVELQSAGGTRRRVMTDATTLIVATDGAEEAARDIGMFVSGATQKWGRMGYLAGGNNPMLFVGDPATTVGICRVPGGSVLQAIYTSAQMQWDAAKTTSLTRHVFAGRLQQGQGASIASATTVTLGADGNVFPISGVTTINGITTATWSAGAVVYLKFAGILTVTHNSGAPGGGAVAIKTTTAANITTAANSIMMLMFDGTFWVQVSPITPGY